MSKTLKMSILLLIITLGILFLSGTEVSALEIDTVEVFKTAVGDTSNETIITLNADVTNNDVFEINGGDYVLDLNGKTLQLGELYVNDGSLTINDSTGKGKLISLYTMISEGAEAVINNGIFTDGISSNLIDNSGKLTINNGTFFSIWNFGNLTINNGDFIDIQNDTGTLAIKGGTFTAKKFVDDLGDGEIGERVYYTQININSNTTIANAEFKTTNLDLVLNIYGNKENEVDESSINNLLDKGYVAQYDSAECTTWAVSYSAVEIVKDESEAILNKIAPNGVWTIKGVEPYNVDDSESLLTAIANKMDLPEGYEVQAWCLGQDNITPEKVHINVVYKGRILLEKDINAVYEKPSESIVENVTPVINKIADKIDEIYIEETGFLLEDLYLINYLNATKDGVDSSEALNFAKDLIKLTNGSNISYKFDSRCGNSGNGLWSFLGGKVIVFYDDVAVDTTKIGLSYANVLYVPSDTADTDEARIAATLKRIEDYLGTKKGISMEVGGTLESITEEDLHWNEKKFFDEKTSGTNYYNLTINEKTYKFVICKKDAIELEKPKYIGSDVISNISITSDATEIPLDTAVTVEAVEENENIEKTLGTSNYVAYDISLYSNAKKGKITELENSKFTVSIPVPEVLKDKEITVYYINNENEKEEYIANVKDDIATFETDHFSTYILAEKVEEDTNVGNNNAGDNNNTSGNDTSSNNTGNTTGNTNTGTSENNNTNVGNTNNNNKDNIKNPQTGDNILFFVGMLLIAAIGLTVTTKFGKYYKTK